VFTLFCTSYVAMASSSALLAGRPRLQPQQRNCRRRLLRCAAAAAVEEKSAVAPPTWMMRLRLERQPPWAYVPDGSVLSIDLGGSLPEVAPAPSPFSVGAASVLSLPVFTESLRKAAVDPRITGVFLRVSTLTCGWAKLAELRRSIESFCKSGKYSVAYLELAQEREFYLASACEEVYAPDSAYVSLRGLSVSASFLRGVLTKVGVEPQVKRIGKYKSAGDQLIRTSMSDAQREVLDSLLEQTYSEWSSGLASGRGKTVEELESLLAADAPAPSAKVLAEKGWLTGTLYMDELRRAIAARTGGAPAELRSVSIARYRATRPQSLGLDVLPPRVGLIRAAGGISRGLSQNIVGGDGIKNEDFVAALQRAKRDPRVKALLVRIDSPGGDALASDLMWRELRSFGKPVIASMVDLAASGGFYMAMACETIVADKLTLTGSIGVITGKFNLQELYKKIGFTKEVLSEGRFAEVDNESRSFTKEEEQFFTAGAESAYASFRDKAALSRGMSILSMEELAQGRVWTGQQALKNGLVDVLGGYDVALALAQRAAGLKEGAMCGVIDFTSQPSGLTALVGPKEAVASVLAAARSVLSGAVSSALSGVVSGASQSATPALASMEPFVLAGADVGEEALIGNVLRILSGEGGASGGGDEARDPLAQ